MQSFKKLFAEGINYQKGGKGKGVTKDEAKALLKRINSALRPEMSQPNVMQNGPDWDLMIRDSEYFTSRPGEEDDDWPDFTGEKEITKRLKSILKGIQWTFSPEEKDWITISLLAKKPTAKAAAKDKKKKLLYVADAVAGEKYDAESMKYRQFYKELYPLLGKWKKKFITKEEFFTLGETSPWFDSDAAEEVWSMAK
jgi:hypothetical protein